MKHGAWRIASRPVDLAFVVAPRFVHRPSHELALVPDEEENNLTGKVDVADASEHSTSPAGVFFTKRKKDVPQKKVLSFQLLREVVLDYELFDPGLIGKGVGFSLLTFSIGLSKK